MLTGTPQRPLIRGFDDQAIVAVRRGAALEASTKPRLQSATSDPPEELLEATRSWLVRW
jgi:hypothetical protein